MKWLLALVLLMPAVAWANCTSETTEKTVTKTIQPNGRELVNTESTYVCKNGKREVFSNCKTYQWNTFLGETNTSKSCSEWNEREATDTALNYARDGVIIEWIDTRGKFKGSIIAWTLPRSNDGECRQIVVSKDYGSSLDNTVRIMCYQEGRGWQYWRR